MGEKIVVGPVNKGLKTNREPFVIDNDSFPVLVNAYQWRGRIKRKRGTTDLTRLQRRIGTTDGTGAITVIILPFPIPSGRVSFTITDPISGGIEVFVDPGGASPVILLTNSNSLATHTLDRATGTLTITGSFANAAVIYFPTLPVMGLEDFTVESSEFPNTVAFDTRYSYNIPVQSPYTAYDVSFYKNPPADPVNLPGYVPKGTLTPVTWNGQDYQQFWTTNYQGALWATNGITIPFTTTNIGMQYGLIAAAVGNPVAIVQAGNGTTTPAIVTITIGAGTPLVIGDFVFINEIQGMTGINFQTGYVTNVAGNVITVEFPHATIAGAWTSGGIVQYLTNTGNTTATPVDTIRWYDGDPTGASGLGWVNFAPPLSESAYSIADLPQDIYYLVGARMIVPFKDRLLFLGPVVMTSAAGSQEYLPDTVIYSQNGTPYYTSSFTNLTSTPQVDNPTLSGITFFPILVPDDQTATAPAYFEDSTGFGGFVTAGIDQAINTVNNNEDVLLIGFEKTQSRFVYTGDDILPFNFFLVNSELGSGSTFSSITMDSVALTIGHRGIVGTSQTGTQRIDSEIPDQVFRFSLAANGTERITAQRDFENEWIYFTYPQNEDIEVFKFPNQTLQYNYRDDSWGIFNETFTHYGQFRPQSGLTWGTLNNHGIFTWGGWNAPWGSSATTLFQPKVIAGNAQGFVVFREPKSTDEAESLAIQNFNGNTVSSPNHGLNNGDYITITGALGAIGSLVNGLIFSVTNVTNANFLLNPSINSTGSDYEGGGLIQRMYVPFIQTKQFPTGWGIGRKTRLGPQQYLFTNALTEITTGSQITLLIYLSQDAETPFNANGFVSGNITGPPNGSLIYSTVLYTCPESTNLGLTPANINLQMVTANTQSQIWHRINTSLIGDTVQLGFTLSDAQMRDLNLPNQFAEIELHGFILDVNPSMVLA